MPNDAIAAIATAPGRGGIGIVRISGLALTAFLRGLIRSHPIEPRRATHASFVDSQGATIDEGVVLFFPAPHSYTGEDVIELQGHGGPVVLNALLQRCVEVGARIAEPGEFTKRAFLNGKIDLAQAESVADLINASTVQAARSAVRSLQGEFSREIDAVVAALTQVRILIEATLDFPEEEIDVLERGQVGSKLMRIGESLAAIIRVSKQGRLLREGVQVVLAGEPNVGKSSLLNALAETERAIVTDIPGTTRDTIRETINLNGVPLHVIDTAGLRDPRDPVERLGIARTWEAVNTADLVLWVSDAARAETHLANAGDASRLPERLPRVHVLNKIDLTDGQPYSRSSPSGREVGVSAKTGVGLVLLKAALLEAVGWDAATEGVFTARERHLQALSEAADCVRTACGETRLELVAEGLRLAQRALGRITGEVTADDLLGEIFSTFCIGK